MPWDLEERLQENPDLVILDVREPYEFDAMHIPGSMNVPQGILESACEWDYRGDHPGAGEGPRAGDRGGVPIRIPQRAGGPFHADTGLPQRGLV